MPCIQLFHGVNGVCARHVFRRDWHVKDGWTKGWKVTDGKGSLLCTWCRMHSSICRWLCPCCCLGDQADIWGFWPGAGLRHPDGWGRRGGGRPEDHLPRVSDSFDLYHFSPLIFPLLFLTSPGSLLPHPSAPGSHFTFFCNSSPV